MKVKPVRENLPDVRASDVNAVASCQVLYMGIPYAGAKRVGNFWYHETPEGYRPFALQSRVRPVIERQQGPR